MANHLKDIYYAFLDVYLSPLYIKYTNKISVKK